MWNWFSGEECESVHDEEDDIYELDDDVSGEDDFSDDDCIGADYDDNQSLSNRVIHFLQGVISVIRCLISFVHNLIPVIFRFLISTLLYVLLLRNYFRSIFIVFSAFDLMYFSAWKDDLVSKRCLFY